MTDVLVLCYHAVSPTWRAALSVTPEALERQLDFLHRQGWQGVTFRQAVLDPPAPRTLAVTFDDAFASVIEHAFPILSSFGLPGTVFAPTAFMSIRQPLSWPGITRWTETPDALELTSMTWNDLGVLRDEGWEVASHTRTHARLTELDEATVREELSGSREECAVQLGRPCMTLAYPYGDVDGRVADLARAAGYEAAGALPHRLDMSDTFRWPRVGVYHGDSRWRFRVKASRPGRRLRSLPVWPDHQAVSDARP